MFKLPLQFSVLYQTECEAKTCNDCELADICLCSLCTCCSVCTLLCTCPKSVHDIDKKIETILGVGDENYR